MIVPNSVNLANLRHLLTRNTKITQNLLKNTILREDTRFVGSLSPREVKLKVHQRCFIREQEVSRGGEASDRASLQKMQEGKVHDGTLL